MKQVLKPTTHASLIQENNKLQTDLGDVRAQLETERHAREHLEQTVAGESARLSEQHQHTVLAMRRQYSALEREKGLMEQARDSLRQDNEALEKLLQRHKHDFEVQSTDNLEATKLISDAAKKEQAKLQGMLQMMTARTSSLEAAISAVHANALKLCGIAGTQVDLRASTPEEQLECTTNALKNVYDAIMDRDGSQAELLRKAEQLEAEVAGLNQRVLNGKTTTGDAEHRLRLSTLAAQDSNRKFNEVLDQTREAFRNEKGNFQKRLEEARGHALELNGELSTARGQNATLEKNLADLSHQYELANQTIQALTLQVDTQKKQLSDEQGKAQRLQYELNRTGDDLKREKMDLAVANSKLEDAQSREASLNTEVSLLELNAKKSIEALAVAQGIQRKSESAQEHATQREKELDAANDDLHQKVVQMTETLSKQQLDKEALQTEVTRLTLERDGFAKENRDLRTLHDTHVAGTVQQLKALDKRLKENQSDINTANDKLKNAHQDMQLLTAERDSARQKVTSLEEDLGHIHEKLVESQASSTKLKSLLRNSTSTLQATIDERDAQLAEAKQDLAAQTAVNRRTTRSLTAKLNDAESLADIEKQNATKAQQVCRLLEEKNRQLHLKLGDAQGEVDIAIDAASTAKRNNIHLRAAVRDLETKFHMSQLSTQTARLTLSPQRTGGRAGSAVDASQMITTLTVQLDKNAEMHDDIDRMRTESAANERRNYDRRLYNLNGLRKTLDTTIDLEKTLQTASLPPRSATSTPLTTTSRRRPDGQDVPTANESITAGPV